METQHYELLYILPMKFTGEEQEKVMEKIAKIIKDQNCEITKNEIWGKRKLTYPIKHIHQGLYVVVEFDAKPAVIANLNQTFKLMPEILRHLIIVKKKLTEEELAEQEKRKEKIIKKEKMEKEEEIQKQVEEIKGDEEQKAKPKTEKEKKEKVSLDDLDKKLDEILKDQIEGN
jgi:small subunit ribosomal protein S6